MKLITCALGPTVGVLYLAVLLVDVSSELVDISTFAVAVTVRRALVVSLLALKDLEVARSGYAFATEYTECTSFA